MPKPKDLAKLLSAKPSAKAWSAIVDWFDGQLAAGAALDDAVAEAATALAVWPETIARPLPYYWIFRVATGAPLPPARLCNAICLSDRWALHPGVTLNGFRDLSEGELARLRATRDLPALRFVDLSLQTGDNPLCPGNMLNNVSEPAELLTWKIFSRATALDLTGACMDVAHVRKALEAMPRLRALALRECELEWSDLRELLLDPILSRLEYLELGYSAAPDDEEEGEALLKDAPLSPKVKKMLRAQIAGDAFDPDEGLFGKMFPGVPGARFEAEGSDDEGDADA